MNTNQAAINYPILLVSRLSLACLRHMSFVPKNQTCIWLCSVPYGMSAIGWSMSLSDMPCPCFNFPCFTAFYEIIARMKWLITNAFQIDVKLEFFIRRNIFMNVASGFRQPTYLSSTLYIQICLLCIRDQRVYYGGICIHATLLLCSS